MYYKLQRYSLITTKYEGTIHPPILSSLSSNLDQSYAYVRVFNAPIKSGTERETVRGEKFVQTSTWRRYFISKASRSPPITDDAKLDIINSPSLSYFRENSTPLVLELTTREIVFRLHAISQSSLLFLTFRRKDDSIEDNRLNITNSNDTLLVIRRTIRKKKYIVLKVSIP